MVRPRKNLSSSDTATLLRARALIHFGRFGFANTSLFDVAEDVGVTRTSLLYHFKSKEKLYDAVVQEAFFQISSELVNSLRGHGSFTERLERMIASFLGYVENHPDLAKLLIREVIDERDAGCKMIVNQGLPILNLVIKFILFAGKVRRDRKDFLREILLQITTSVMLKSASGQMRETVWGKNSRTRDLARLLLTEFNSN